MFINFSNHPSSLWSPEQRDAAEEYGEIIDLKFPIIDPSAPSFDIRKMACQYADMIIARSPDVVMCQGEFTLAYNVIHELKKAGIMVVAACSERKTVDTYENGETERISIFEFKQFREY